MSQEERDEEATAVREYERMRSHGVSLMEIGVARAQGKEVEVTFHPIGVVAPEEKKSSPPVYVENV